MGSPQKNVPTLTKWASTRQKWPLDARKFCLRKNYASSAFHFDEKCQSSARRFESDGEELLRNPPFTTPDGAEPDRIRQEVPTEAEACFFLRLRKSPSQSTWRSAESGSEWLIFFCLTTDDWHECETALEGVVQHNFSAEPAYRLDLNEAAILSRIVGDEHVAIRQKNCAQ